MPRKSLKERFFEKQDRSGGPTACWPWKGAIGANGYGQFRSSPTMSARKAHRVAWEIANGRPFPEGMVARHECDRPDCTNPLHITPGTALENSRDCIERNRIARGERNGRATLGESQAVEIKRRLASGESVTAVATAMGVAVWNVTAIRIGRSWRHVAPESEAA